MEGWHYGKGLISYWYYMITKPGQGKWVCNLNKLVVSKQRTAQKTARYGFLSRPGLWKRFVKNGM